MSWKMEHTTIIKKSKDHFRGIIIHKMFYKKHVFCSSFTTLDPFTYVNVCSFKLIVSLNILASEKLHADKNIMLWFPLDGSCY
uniref:Uncharacterized protein n=1 Tax=Arundo donax TaxID=35708 RepID=A0A0A9C355_ARUDO